MIVARAALAAYDGDERSVVDLLVDQVEFADVIVLNKLDLVDAGTLGSVKQLLYRLNPGAKVVEATNSVVPVRIGTGTM
jgi:G3E family GTPase